PLSSSLVGSKGTRTIFDAGANLLVNSSFEDSSNSWRLEDWDGSTGKWRIVPGGIHGNYCLESYDSDGTATGNPTNAVAYQLVTLPTALTSSKVYTLSAYAKRTGLANPVLGIQCFDKNGAEIAGSYKNYQKDIDKDRWVKVSESFNLPIGTKSLFVILRSAVSGTDTVSFDAVQMEEGSSFTAYSPSRSDNSKPYYDLGIDKKSGTLSVWFNTTGAGTRMIFSNESKTALFNLYINEQNKIVLNSLNKSNAGQNIITANDIIIANNTWYFIALKWQLVESSFYSRTLQCTLYINSRTYTGSVTDFKDFTGAITAVGSNPYGNYSLSGTLDDFAYSRKALSDRDIQLLYNKTMPEDKGTTVTNSYTYENDKIKTISHNGFSYRFEYDSLGNTRQVYAENELLIRNEFDAETGNLTKSEYGNNQRVSMEYDELDRVTKRKFSRDILDNSQKDEIRYSYEYDNEGNLAYHEDRVNFRDYKYSYDLSDRLVKIDEYDKDIGTSSYGKTYSTKFDYDMSNNHSIITEKIDEK
ncbi:carbohydrate binding domain-containing protein, partial [Clostridium sp. A1-XYC3]